MEGRHEEALRKVVQMLPHCQNIVPLPPRAGVETSTLHAGTETADGVTLRQRSSLFKYPYNYSGKLSNQDLLGTKPRTIYIIRLQSRGQGTQEDAVV